MKRGEVWHARVLGRSDRYVAIVGHDQVSAARDAVLCVQIDRSPGQTATLLSVPVDLPVQGFARAVTVGPLSKQWMVERLGVLDDAVVEQIDVALRAALDL